MIEAKEQSIGATLQSIEIEFHFVEENEQIASTGDYFSSTTEHFVSTTWSSSSIECTLCFETYHSFWIEESFASENWKVWSQKEQAVSIEEQPSSIEYKVVSIECKVAAIDCEVVSIECKVAAIDCKVVSIECSFRPIEAQGRSIEAPARSIETSVAPLEGAVGSTVVPLTPLTRDRSQSHNALDDFARGRARAKQWIPSRIHELDEAGQKRHRACAFRGRRGPIVTTSRALRATAAAHASRPLHEGSLVARVRCSERTTRAGSGEWPSSDRPLRWRWR